MEKSKSMEFEMISNLEYNHSIKSDSPRKKDHDDDNDEERLLIRAELANMSFEDLHKLKDEIGSKLYSKTVFKQPGKVRKKSRDDTKRRNKNYPQEMSSKKPVSIVNNIIPVKKVEPRDPRFDSLCGTFDKKEFKKNYNFLKRFRTTECEALKNELKETEDPDRIKKIKYLIQRIENQDREEKLLKMKEMKKEEEKSEYIAKLRRGEKPIFRKKSEKRILELVDHYEELKQKGKLKKHIEKQRKRNIQKDRKKNPHMVS